VQARTLRLAAAGTAVSSGVHVMQLTRFSLGVGDRFAHQGVAQLDALLRAMARGVTVTPVWNKSHREHRIVGSAPGEVRDEADRAVKARRWKGPYFVDADHINLGTVDGFVASSDFFTLDVADQIGAAAAADELDRFVAKHKRYVGWLEVAGIEQPLGISLTTIVNAGRKYLAAIQQAASIYRRIAAAKGADAFITEISLDETDVPQTPAELFFILAAAADQGIPLRTIAPRFSGRFNKGVDYVGDAAQFADEFERDLAVVALAVREFGLPDDLKLSVHSGSDKFSLYGPMHRALDKFRAGVHLKTAGTTWLEELIGLALAGGDGLEIAKQVYVQAIERLDELCAPYASVVDIDRAALPTVWQVRAWDGPAFAAALRHDPTCPEYNLHFRQLLHVGYKVAAEMGSRFTDALEAHAGVIAANVTANLYDRHIRPLFLGAADDRS
jgi:tagaturonate epimerase